MYVNKKTHTHILCCATVEEHWGVGERLLVDTAGPPVYSIYC